MKRNINLILSSSCFIYFACLIYISFKHIVLNNFFSGIFELITIPLIILTIVMLAFNIQGWYLENFLKKSSSFLSIVILLTTIILMTLATIFDV
ncbi:hypothetical protein SAMN05443669_100258 [Flavobacterium xanthum]|uniref:Uncharacterized protein n=1 Tax=Flavobacterium xanthum TaxID=69322 RepID=A0A1M6XV13_9FLAO|nr:hypothetical protein SAMN05443669_100258 [Flavobacterium xanthum]